MRCPHKAEQESVRTTIVGGRPPGSGQPVGEIPRGIDVMVAKASIDPDFRETLLAHRSKAADSIGLNLDPAEAAMLDIVPEAQLVAVIDRTKVHPKRRAAFLGRAASVMLAALGAGAILAGACAPTLGISPEHPVSKGIQPDPPKQEAPAAVEDAPGEVPAAPPDPPTRPDRPAVSVGILPDVAEEVPPAAEEEVDDEIPPPPTDPVTRGIRPDRP